VRRITKVLLIFLLMVPVSVSANDAEMLVNTGDSLFNLYEYEESINYYDESLALDSMSSEAYCKLARSLNLLAELQPKEKQLELFERAAWAAEKTVGLDSLEPEGHFQLARALGKIALFKGVFKSVSLAKRVKKETEITLRLKPDHDGALHIIGRWHREISRKPKFIRIPLGLGDADKKKGLPLLAEAIKLKPDVINHRLEYAISLMDSDYKNEAKDQFEVCLSLKASSPLDIKYQKQAKECLAKLE